VARRWRTLAVKRPLAVLGVALAGAVTGWVVDSGRDAVNATERLGPDNREAHAAATFRKETRFAGDASVLVTAPNVTAPKVVRWMADYQRRVLSRHRYSDERPCAAAELCPELSLANLVSGNGAGAQGPGSLLGTASSSFSRAVISRDRRAANVAFAVSAEARGRQQALYDDMRRELDPPPGVHAEVAGLPVLLAAGGGEVDSARFEIVILALLLAWIALLVGGLAPGAAAVPLLAAALASGWAALVAALIGPALDPVSSVVGALVVGLSAASAAALSQSYRAYRERGIAPSNAIDGAYGAAGRLIAAPLLLMLAGALAAIPADVRLVHDFGWTTMIELVTAFAVTGLVLPSVLVWAEEPGRAAVRVPRTRAEAAEAARNLVRGARSGLGVARSRATGLVALLRRRKRAGGRGGGEAERS
jgi:predicted RND superfamily exporter protein